MNDRAWLILATFLSLLSSGWGIYAFKARKNHHSHWNNALLFGAFCSQFTFLALRGRAIGHCPVSNFFEVIAFVTWSLLLTFMVVGSVYRFSILGFFTAPIVALLNLFALVLPIDIPSSLPKMSWALELHASVTLLAYGPLGLTAIAGTLYLIQDRQLKQHAPGPWFYEFPDMGEISMVLRRTLFFGFGLLTIGLIAGILVTTGRGMDWVKFGWSLLVWVFYAVLYLTPRLTRSFRRTAWLSVVGFTVVLLTFWGVNSLSHLHRYGL